MRGASAAPYRVCQRCGAHLDPGERCTCGARTTTAGSQRPDSRRDETGIFMIPARHCRRCGGIVRSAAALKCGYGSRCRTLAREQARFEREYPQFDIFSLQEGGSA